MTTVAMGIAMFTFVVLAMVAILLLASRSLVGQGEVHILINDDEAKSVDVPTGGTLLSTLAGAKVFVPSACGGGGTCAQCKVQVYDGGGDLLPTEEGHINRGMAKEHWRLACQVKVKQDMKIHVPDEIFAIRKWECEVVSNDNVASFIKEFKVQLPPGEELDFESGGYIQIEIPPYDLSYKNFEIGEEYREDWDKYDLWRFRSVNTETIERAYSMANYPAEGNIVMLNVRIASPPPNLPDVPPGIGSSYIFSKKPGDKVTISGPFGEFFIKPTEREMCYIGGGAGMAPLRSHLMHLFRTLKTGRKVNYWYGARSLREIFYEEDFRAIEREFPNFKFHIALSEPKPEDNWTGFTGFIHAVARDEYLAKHDAPEEIEYYLCGPPMMNKAVFQMLDELGVDIENVAFDDFG
ncbi:MAG: NADH:ubiquinone reductase (Na(+)-transporting) subunit F [Deltaproteobacteria bacterium]|nr:NADH:ubiquinone reductase (Na(+)-transporting) subunit F [Deltaproteobacteria bacterium]MCB9478429.1 NADH:ubiquinone reductase (Na(+)-transporting) subunit F [Deltaproteobacteria bacterium]MCB9490294.1 NADH:ubiquinone reductase (Na(+)-transporting) subunit F [Deltaproteobacteria bacterium]